jgi:hypothetical protein
VHGGPNIQSGWGFGISTSTSSPRPFSADSEPTLLTQTLEQVELADRVGSRSRVGGPPPLARGVLAAELGGFLVAREQKRHMWHEPVDAITRMLVGTPFDGIVARSSRCLRAMSSRRLRAMSSGCQRALSFPSHPSVVPRSMATSRLPRGGRRCSVHRLRIRRRGALVAAALALGACGSSASMIHSTPATSTTTTTSTVSTRPAPTSGEAQAVGATNELALDLLRTTAPPSANTVFSPYSLQAALAMVYAGAAGDTATRLGHVLRAPSATALARANAALSRRLTEAVSAPHNARPGQVPH